MASSLLLATSGWLACAPGVLDCEVVTNQEYCGNGGGAAGDSGGMAGSTGGRAGSTAGSGGRAGSTGGNTAGSTGGSMAMAGSGGRGGSTGGSMGGSTGGMPTANTPISCATYDTLGKMDMFFAAKCATEAACHGTNAPWTDMKAPNVWMRLLNKKPVIACGMSQLIDSANPDNSIILLKVKSPTAMLAACPPGGGSSPGEKMPPPSQAAKYPALSAAEVTCLENFIKAAAGK